MISSRKEETEVKIISIMGSGGGGGIVINESNELKIENLILNK